MGGLLFNPGVRLVALKPWSQPSPHGIRDRAAGEREWPPALCPVGCWRSPGVAAAEWVVSARIGEEDQSELADLHRVA